MLSGHAQTFQQVRILRKSQFLGQTGCKLCFWWETAWFWNNLLQARGCDCDPHTPSAYGPGYEPSLVLMRTQNLLYEYSFKYHQIQTISVSLISLKNKYEPWHDKTNKVAVCPMKTQISLGICPGWSESSSSAWRKLGSLATHWAHSEDSDQTGWMPRLIWVFAGCKVIFLVLSWGGSIMFCLAVFLAIM